MKILATLDGSNASLAVLPVLTRLAKETKAEVTLLTVTKPEEGFLRQSPGVTEVVPGGAAGPLAVPLMRAEAIIRPDEPAWAETKGQAIERAEAEAQDWLQDFARPLRDAGVAVAEEVVMAEEAAEAVIDFARKHAFDLIAMATHGRSGLREAVQGSVARAVLRSGVAPVLLVRPPDQK